MLNAPSTNFVHLHIRSGYSFFQSTVQPRTLFDRINELGMPALAIVDDGNMAGAMDFHLKGKGRGIKGIIGTTVTVKDRSETFSLVLLCENLIGYRNLCRIVSSHTITRGTLTRHSAGLITLSGGMYGPINALCLQGKTEAAEKLADWLSRTFPERFFIELHPVVTPEQIEINKNFRQFAARLKIPTVATAPCHYLRKEDRPALEALRHLGKLPSLAETFPDGSGDAYWLMSPEEISAAFVDDPESISQSSKIADLCQLEMETTSEIHAIPAVRSGNDPDDELHKQAMAGLERKTAATEIYRKRLDYELAFIRQEGFSPWFLLAADVAAMARDAGIQLGAGMGANPSSLVSYVLGLSELDPIEYGLIFERFLNPNRYFLPDIFVSVPQNRHAELIQLIVGYYGRDKVAMPADYNRLGGRGFVKKLGSYLRIEDEKISRLIRLCPECSAMNWGFVHDLLEGKEAQKMIAADEELARLMETAKRLNDLPCRVSLLKNEVLITSDPLEEYLPVSQTRSISRTHYYYGMVRTVGLPTLSVQGFDSLTVIDRLARQKNINLPDIPLDDVATWQLIASGDTKGVFELGSSGIRKILCRAQPTSLAELAATVSLHRPGPIGKGMLDEFIRAKHGGCTKSVVPEKLAEILAETRGIIVYQEQIMEIIHRLAGYLYSDADEFRRKIGRQDAELNAGLRREFLVAAERSGTQRGIADNCFELMIDSAPHTFNKSHALSCALNSYRAAYLKAHFPHEFKNLRK